MVATARRASRGRVSRPAARRRALVSRFTSGLWGLSLLCAAQVALSQPAVLDDFERDNSVPWTWSGPGRLSTAPGHAPDCEGQRVMRVETTAELRGTDMWWGELRLTPPPVTDWRPYHFLSVWVRALGGRRVHSLGLYAENGANRLESHHVVLPRDQWTRVVYPITHLVRDNISVFFFSHGAAGGLPGEALDEVYEFDNLMLEGGPPADMGGWAVAPGKASFAHCGYRPEEPKRVLFPPETRGPIALRRADGYEVRNLRAEQDAFGNLAVDLTDLREPGQYVVEAGNVKTEPFAVGSDAWQEPARAVVRFIYLMRCGGTVEDSKVGHGPCHLDNCKPAIADNINERQWPLAKKHLEMLGDWMDLVGGWHDAGIIDQYTGNTGLMTYALAWLAQVQPEVGAEALEEAKWGGQWLVKATLPTGEMVGDSGGQVRWTDNIPRTADDRTVNVAGSWPDHAMKAVAGMARLAVLVRESDERLHMDLVTAVRRAIRHYAADVFPGYMEDTYHFNSWGALAGAEAYAATGDDVARQFALSNLARLVECQDQGTGEGSGFFYERVDRKHPYRFPDGQGVGVLALVRAYEVFHDHEQASTWREAVRLWCDGYAVPMSKFAGAYRIVAFGLYDTGEDQAYRGEESWWARPWDPKVFAAWQPATGELRLGGRRVRVFGAHYGGNNRHLCMTAAALGAAARLLGRQDLTDLAAEQLQWVTGHNPLSQCLISHVGHRSPLAYQPIIGDVHGSMYQGIGSQNGDDPFLSPNCYYTQKEIWGICGGTYLLAVAAR